MLDDLRELYQEVILDHGKRPRNLRRLDAATGQAHGDNPLCGDTVTIYLAVDDAKVIQDVSFEGHGCAISIASASMLTELLRGRPAADAMVLFSAFHKLCTGAADDAETALAGERADLHDGLDKLAVLSGVRDFPSRVKCATLAWHTMQAALEGQQQVSTE